MSGRLLVVDLSNQVYKAASVHPTLSSGDAYTGGLFGFLIAVCSAIHETKATDIVIAADAPPYLRSEAYPGYKKVRKKAMDEDLKESVRESMGYVRRLCDVLGLPIWAVPGFEYDDLFAHVAMKYRHRYDKVIGLTNDSDLFQFMWSAKVAMFKGKKGGGLYGQEEFRKEWPDVVPEDIPLLLSMTGTHNDVEGIAGVGPVTAMKALKDPALMRKIRDKGGDIIDRNLPLITLPHPDFPWEETIPKPIKSFSNVRPLYKFCSMFDIEVTKYMTDALERVLHDD